MAENDSTSLSTLSDSTSQDDTFTSWRSIFSYLAGQMTLEQRYQFRQAQDLKNEEFSCQRCEKHRDHLLKHSPIIRFMRDNINQLGGDINRENVHCRRCPGLDRAGGFNPQYGIMLCANVMRNRGHTEDTLAHEMIHAYDHFRFKVDWENNLRQAACAEIRAISLSGECRFMREFYTRRQWNVTQQHQECVRRRAAQSVMSRPNCKDQEAADRAVNEVFQSCFADTRPFDEIYR